MAFLNAGFSVDSFFTEPTEFVTRCLLAPLVSEENLPVNLSGVLLQ